MSLKTHPAIFAAALILVAAGPALALGSAASQPPSGGSEADAIKQLIAKYAAAVNSEPVDIHLASQIWANSPDVSFINPLGEEHGWEAIKQNFYEDIMEALFSERKLSTRNIQMHIYSDSGWSEFEWHFVAKLRKSGSIVQTDGRETQIYRKIGPKQWVLVHVHYSAMPAGHASSAAVSR